MEDGLPTVALVHGAWHGPWAWDDLRRKLDLAGIPSTAVSLPSVGERTDRLGGLTDDVAAVSAALDDLTGPFVLVGHSYGGIPVTEVAATRSDVVHTVYVCAFVIPVGTSLADITGGKPGKSWVVSEDGLSILRRDPRSSFYSECDPAVADAAVAKLRPHSMRSVQEPLRKAAYGQMPASYVVCELDNALPADAQRGMADMAGAATVSLDTDHSPMLNRPAELALILSGIVARNAAERS